MENDNNYETSPATEGVSSGLIALGIVVIIAVTELAAFWLY